MISLFSSEFLFHPAAVQISGNTCSHHCVYCFANANSRSREWQIKSVINTLKKVEPKTLLDNLINEGYPICLSNLVDPFASNNYKETLAILPYLTRLKNGLFIQTKSGEGIEEAFEILKDKKNIVWYVSLTTLNEKIARRIEPQAPTPKERLKLLEEANKKGYYTIAALNPCIPTMITINEIEEYIKVVKNIGTDCIIIEGLHLSPSQKKLKLYKEIQNKTKYRTYLRTIVEAVRESGMVTHKMYMPYSTTFPDMMKKHLGLTMPTNQEFINWCFKQDYKNGIEINIEKYLEVMTEGHPIFKKEFNSIKSYPYRIDTRLWKVWSNTGRLKTFEDLLKFYWNSKTAGISLMRNILFKEIKKDNNSNPVLFFNGKYDVPQIKKEKPNED